MSNRRPIKARSTQWANQFTQFLVQKAVTPNQISIASIGFAAVGALVLVAYPQGIGLLFCALMVQMRLLCNLFDGMVAIEGGKQSVLGHLYNEFPDRIADSLLIVGLGYALSQPSMGWLGALLAALTAYVRVFGGALGLAQSFQGPMAKQHRMAVLSVACIMGAIEQWQWHSLHSLQLALYLIVLGSLATCVTRTWAIATQLNNKSD